VKGTFFVKIVGYFFRTSKVISVTLEGRPVMRRRCGGQVRNWGFAFRASRSFLKNYNKT
jgi:hypothetical protein